MKGIIFNLLEQIVTEQHGADVWDTLLAKTELSGAYTALGNYPDEDLGKLAAAAAQLLGIEVDEVIRWVGKSALPKLAERYPQFFDSHDNTRSFVLSLNDIIHPEVRKLYPGADAPDFVFDTSSEEVLVMEYSSKRKLCAFAHGLIEGAAERFGEKAIIEQETCMLRGDNCCRFRLGFQPAIAPV